MKKVEKLRSQQPAYTRVASKDTVIPASSDHVRQPIIVVYMHLTCTPFIRSNRIHLKAPHDLIFYQLEVMGSTRAHRFFLNFCCFKDKNIC